MKFALKILLPLALLFAGLGFYNKVRAENIPNAYLFYSLTCPHCKKEEAFLETIKDRINLTKFEVTTNRENSDLYVKVVKALNIKTNSVPLLVIGNQYILGYNTDETTGAQIASLVTDQTANFRADIVQEVINGNPFINVPEASTTSSAAEDRLQVPFLGLTDLKTLSLPVLTFVIALVDGFNPCAMWTLLFLISILLGMNSRKKMFLIGGTFIFVSGLIYFMFLSAWLNFYFLIGFSNLIRILIGVLALGIGIYYLRDYFNSKKPGCTVADEQKKQQFFEKAKKIVNQKSLPAVLLGISLLAVAVNSIEIVCSAGLPAVYTKILSMAQLPTWKYYMYLLLYIFIYMLDDLIIFTLAVVTLESHGIKSKYAKYSHLIGAILMIVIGILLLFNPAVLAIS